MDIIFRDNGFAVTFRSEIDWQIYSWRSQSTDVDRMRKKATNKERTNVTFCEFPVYKTYNHRICVKFEHS